MDILIQQWHIILFSVGGKKTYHFKVWYLELSFRKESKYNLGKENWLHEQWVRDIKSTAQVPAAESQHSLTGVVGAKPMHGSWEWRSPPFSCNSLKMLSKWTQRAIFYWAHCEQSLPASKHWWQVRRRHFCCIQFDVHWLGTIWPSPSGFLLGQHWKLQSSPGSQSSQTLRIWVEVDSQLQNMGSPKPSSGCCPI